MNFITFKKNNIENGGHSLTNLLEEVKKLIQDNANYLGEDNFSSKEQRISWYLFFFFV